MAPQLVTTRSCSVLGSGSENLQAILRSKQRALELQLGSMGPDELRNRLTSLIPPSPPPPPHSLLRAIHHRRVSSSSASSSNKEVALVVEVARSNPSDPPEVLGAVCCDYASWGVDAIAVRTDEAMSPDGLADLLAVCNSVGVPVIRADWILHPLQVAETKEAGGAALVTVYAVLKEGLSGLLKYASSLCLDPIVEVINMKDLEAVSDMEVILYGINLSVGISLPVPGLREDIAKSLLKKMPSGTHAIVGVRSEEEALVMKHAGASAIYLRHGALEELMSKEGNGERCLRRLREVLSG